MFPDSLILGMEIRIKVADYVMDRITALRWQYPDQYQNIACLRTNAMKYLPCYFHKGQVRTEPNSRLVPSNNGAVCINFCFQFIFS